MNRQGKLDPSALEPGSFRAGKYHLGKPIGEGGFGVVYSATQVDLGRSVAIKFIKGRDPEMHERFRREAQLMAKFRSPYVVKVHEFGVDDPVEFGQVATGVPYVVMEYVEGLTLHDWVRKHGPLTPLSAATVLRQLLEVLAEARHLGVVHRDIKPQNIILTPPRSRLSTHVLHGQERVGDAVLLDFGIAGWTNSNQPSELTRTGATLGTLRYIAPECFSASDDSTVGQRSDHKTDLYALGLTAYYMLIGQEPFAELDQTQILRRQQDYALNNRNPLHLAFVDGPGLAEVINKLAHPDRAQRYDTAEEVMSHLESLSHSGVAFEAHVAGVRIPLDIQGMEPTERQPAGSFGPRKWNFESIAPVGDMQLSRQLFDRLNQREQQLPAPTAQIADDDKEQTPAHTPRAHERMASRQTLKTARVRPAWIAPALALGIPLSLALAALLASQMGDQAAPEQPAPAAQVVAQELTSPPQPVQPSLPKTELPSPVLVDASRAVHLANSMASMTADALAASVAKNKGVGSQKAKTPVQATVAKRVEPKNSKTPAELTAKKEPAETVKEPAKATVAAQAKPATPDAAPSAPVDAPKKKKRLPIVPEHFLDL